MYVLVKDNDMLLDTLVLLLTIPSCKVCINGEGQYYAAGYISVSSDNIILYRYIFCLHYSAML